ncbi:histidine kinase, partial [Nocardia cyriacigeorgica]|nr:histidine kinase [Nocardia cyriacigeorgica]
MLVANTLPERSLARVGAGMGLTGMRQRAEMLGGRMTAGPDGDGWSVEVRFPHTPTRHGVMCEWLAAGLPVRMERPGRPGRDVAFGPGATSQENR